MSHVPHMDESCPKYEWVVSHIWRVLSHIWISHVPHMRVMSQIWMSHKPQINVSYMNASYLTYEWVIYKWVVSHLWTSHFAQDFKMWAERLLAILRSLPMACFWWCVLHIFIYIYIYIYISTYICIYIHIYVYVCINIDMIFICVSLRSPQMACFQ